jgi:hypothetical protein
MDLVEVNKISPQKMAGPKLITRSYVAKTGTFNADRLINLVVEQVGVNNLMVELERAVLNT